MRSAPLLAVIALATLPAAAQTGTEATFSIERAEAGIATDGLPLPLQVDWTYSAPPGAAAAAPGGVQLRWTGAKCDHPGLLVTGPLDEHITLTPTQGDYQDTTTFPMFPVNVTGGGDESVVVTCSITGQVSGGGPTLRETQPATATFAVVVMPMPEDNATALKKRPQDTDAAAPGAAVVAVLGLLAVAAVVTRRRA